MIVYHFNPEFAPFGYLGVDLFFIISGFLITKQLIKSIEQESFEIKKFYFKRFKRIIPALVSSSIFTILKSERHRSEKRVASSISYFGSITA